MTRVINRSDPAWAGQTFAVGEVVNIMRPSKWGNPFVIGRNGTREQVIEKYRGFLRDNPPLIKMARAELAGKVLVCCCKPLACHGDVLARVADGGEP